MRGEQISRTMKWLTHLKEADTFSKVSNKRYSLTWHKKVVCRNGVGKKPVPGGWGMNGKGGVWEYAYSLLKGEL